MPSMPKSAVPPPATVMIMGSPSTLQIRLLPVSAMKRLPKASTATPVGALSWAEVARTPPPKSFVSPPPANSGDAAVAADLADPVAAGIGDEEVPEASTATPVGASSRAEVAGMPLLDAEVRRPAARIEGDDAGEVTISAGGADLADPVVTGIGDEEVAGGVHRDARGRVEPGRGGRDAVDAEVRRPPPATV